MVLGVDLPAPAACAYEMTSLGPGRESFAACGRYALLDREERGDGNPRTSDAMEVPPRCVLYFKHDTEVVEGSDQLRVAVGRIRRDFRGRLQDPFVGKCDASVRVRDDLEPLPGGKISRVRSADGRIAPVAGRLPR